MMESVLKYWPIIWSVINLLALWGIWSLKRAIPTHEDVAKVAASVDTLEEDTTTAIDELKDETSSNIEQLKVDLASQGKDIVRLEEAVKRAPTHADIKELSKRIEELHGDLKEVVGGLTGIRRAVDLMNSYLLNGRAE